MTLLDPALLSRIAGLEVRARTIVEGAIAGRHRSPHHGSSVEFAEHKEYSPGDDIKHIDWKALGKFDRYYVKRFEEEAELRALLLFDTSGSMSYAGRGASKLDYARELAAALAYLLLQQQDLVGLLAFGQATDKYIPPRSRGTHLRELLLALEAARAQGPTRLDAALDQVSELARRRSLLVVLSDLLDVPDRAATLLRSLRARRHDVVVLHVLDPDELDFPFDEPLWLKSPEDERRLLVEPARARKHYLEAVERFTSGWRHRLREGDVDYHLVRTDRPHSEILLELLTGPLRRPTGSA